MKLGCLVSIKYLRRGLEPFDEGTRFQIGFNIRKLYFVVRDSKRKKSYRFAKFKIVNWGSDW